MTTPPLIPLPVHMVLTADDLAAAARDMARQPRIAVDTESNGFFRYPERVCLMQFATDANIYLVDPLAVEDVSALGTIFEDPKIEKVLHGADYDIRSLDREWGYHLRNLFDTGIAAHFLGMDRLGLGVIIEELLGRTVLKEKRLQRADWSIRPLSDEALLYAAADVAHLLELRTMLGEKLSALDRERWVAEEVGRLSEVRHSPVDPETAFLSMKGSGGLGPHSLAILRSLWEFRERLARRLDRPPFKILSDKPLLFLAENPDSPLDEVPGLGTYVISRWGKGLRDAVMEGIAGPPVMRPRVPREKITPEEFNRRQEALKTLKAWRTEEGTRLSLDPSLVWPMVSLERLARDPEGLEQEIAAVEVRNWQRLHISPILKAKLTPPGRGALSEAVHTCASRFFLS